MGLGAAPLGGPQASVGPPALSQGCPSRCWAASNCHPSLPSPSSHSAPTPTSAPRMHFGVTVLGCPQATETSQMHRPGSFYRRETCGLSRPSLLGGTPVAPEESSLGDGDGARLLAHLPALFLPRPHPGAGRPPSAQADSPRGLGRLQKVCSFLSHAGCPARQARVPLPRHPHMSPAGSPAPRVPPPHAPRSSWGRVAVSETRCGYSAEPAPASRPDTRLSESQADSEMSPPSASRDRPHEAQPFKRW